MVNVGNFDVWEESGKGYVATALCNVGGCTADYIECETLEEARQLALQMTAEGKSPRIVPICGRCQAAQRRKTRCPVCGALLEPMYEPFPDWVKFCPRCDFRA